MTRKHFRTLADDLGRARSLTDNAAEFDRAVDALIHTLYDVNPRFCRDTFTEAIAAAETGCRERREALHRERIARADSRRAANRAAADAEIALVICGTQAS